MGGSGGERDNEPFGGPGFKEERAMSHYVTLYSIVFMIGFVYLFDRRHQRHRFWRLLASVMLMTPEEVDMIRKIQSAGQEE